MRHEIPKGDVAQLDLFNIYHHLIDIVIIKKYITKHFISYTTRYVNVPFRIWKEKM